MYPRLNPAKWLLQDMWLQNICHPSVILHNLVEKKSWDKVQSGHTQSELKSNQEPAKYLVFVWPGYALLWESFIWLKLAGGRVGKVEVGFVFSNLIVLHAAEESEIPEVFLCDAQKTANDHKQNNNFGVQWGRALRWQDVVQSQERAKRVKLWTVNAGLVEKCYNEWTGLSRPARPSCLFKAERNWGLSSGWLTTNSLVSPQNEDLPGKEK